MDMNSILQLEKQMQQVNERLEQQVQEMLLKCDIMKTMIENPHRNEEIRKIYELAVGLEERRGLSKFALKEYVDFLIRQGDYETALPIAERYLVYMKLEGDEKKIADAESILAMLHTK